jgi:nucleoside-diphosphate kinase
MLIKPDGVGRGLIGNILSRVENKGYRFSAMKMVTPTKTILKKHYSEHIGNPRYHNGGV